MAGSMEVKRTASTVAGVEIDVVAPRHFVWNIATHVDAWSTWQPDRW